MRTKILLRGALALLAAALLASPQARVGASSYTTKVYRDSGGDRQVVASGGSVALESGGSVTVASGGLISVDSGGSVQVSGDHEIKTGGRLKLETGSTLEIESGVTFTVERAGVQRTFSHGCKVGATAGWVVAAGDDLSLATLPAESTASTMVCALTGLKVGDTITAFSLVGQIESAGGAVTLDANLRKLTAATADVTDASVGSITQVAASADAIVSAAKSGLTEVVAADETFYILITGTTAAATDIALQGFTVTVTES